MYSTIVVTEKSIPKFKKFLFEKIVVFLVFFRSYVTLLIQK